MALKEKWKDTGKNTGSAFGNFGKAIGKTAKVVFSDEENKQEENGHTELSNSWRETGKSFGEAGKSLGKALQGTGRKILDVENEEDKKEAKAEEPVVEDATEVVEEEKK